MIRVPLSGKDGYEFEAYFESMCIVFRVPAEKVVGGREWAIFAPDGVLVETREKAEAIRIARVWKSGGAPWPPAAASALEVAP